MGVEWELCRRRGRGKDDRGAVRREARQIPGLRPALDVVEGKALHGRGRTGPRPLEIGAFAEEGLARWRAAVHAVDQRQGARHGDLLGKFGAWHADDIGGQCLCRLAGHPGRDGRSPAVAVASSRAVRSPAIVPPSPPCKSWRQTAVMSANFKPAETLILADALGAGRQPGRRDDCVRLQFSRGIRERQLCLEDAMRR